MKNASFALRSPCLFGWDDLCHLKDGVNSPPWGTLWAIVRHSSSFPIFSVPRPRCRRSLLVSPGTLQPPSSTHPMAITCIHLAVAPAPASPTPGGSHRHHPYLPNLNPSFLPPPSTVTWVGPHPLSHPSNVSLGPSHRSAPRTFEPASNREVSLFKVRVERRR